MEAAAAAPEKKRAKFEALIGELGAGDEEVQDLLDEGKLWSNWKERVKGTERDDTLASFFDFCKRESQWAPVAAAGMEGHKQDFFSSPLL